MFTRIEKDFGVRLPLQTLFARPTIASIAHALESGEVELAHPSLEPVRRATRRFDGEPPHWGSDIGDALVRVVNRFVPVRYDGPVDAIRAFESGAGPLARLALRRAASSARVAYTRAGTIPRR